ncbi:Prophage integrase IntA [Methylobacterium adhaesivum]|uniref:Integrase arm-type DNA-binding domain-containing protein n=1 Tax=Methylobacterium adhaesivum TaxID=333297 RepID=A0ABT8BJ31_9HYPH|nr:site-specific integrase [Methylobacterium adhaesivum]MDN3592172.1 integrase arm-type DNA-binding domain-containing protein [Methylobacterium adhaesivum]GJD32573.1 Prophage integrase IntA [Methylobacterium adhaesivum]
MAHAVNKLTALGVSKLKEPGRYGDGAGLYLMIDPGGSRRWQMIFRHGGKQREMGLGSASLFSLADARRKRDETHRLIAEGRDPIAEKRKPDPVTVKAVTFGEFADQHIAEITKGFRNEKHKAQWTSSLRNHASSLRSKALADITTDDVLSVVKPIWHTNNETASRVRGRIEQILDAAKARGLRTGENPARWRGHLNQLLSKRRKLQKGHHTALPYADLPCFIDELRKRTGVSALALEFAILSGGRVGEVLKCPWSEIDRVKKVWSIPAARMKAERDHRVPLTPRMLEILDAVEPLRRGDYVFPSFRADKPLSDMVFAALYKRMGRRITTHGFRSTFRDWVGDETNYQREVAEAALSHVVGDSTEAAYRRGDALEKRRELMLAWEAFVTSEAA